ncbi:class F sortase [Amnibacterium flavum]|uniref:Class F sortase n=1 Tax=Amnibacterium flavum TaxID=2173173 RepID=A0A2V1HUH2_9MICO|nr:class F sortase [Amnibacterium flavum]PVZ93947.1 class F sortase [Amnibacterium flavum]
MVPPTTPNVRRTARVRSRLVAFGGALAVIGIALTGCTPAPAPAAAPTPVASSAASALAADAPQEPAAAAQKVASAPPIRVRIPDIGVDAPLEDLHRDSSGVLLPPEEWMSAGWYVDGVAPGEIGPSVIAGHVDTVSQVAVFVDLEKLQPGARVEVDLADGTTTAFQVDRTIDVSKKEFPTAEVYGPTPDAQLRLITCNGPFDDAEHRYANNIVVFATRVA